VPLIDYARTVADRLSPRHLVELRDGSGLTDQTIVDAGFETVVDPARIARELNWRGSAAGLGECLRIPFRDPMTGQFSGFARYKPSTPRRDVKGKAIKYEQPLGSPIRPYFPLEVVEAAKQPGFIVGITEGEKKSLAAGQAGCPCIGLTGVFSWQKKREDKKKDRELIPGLSAINWAGSTVWICFDTDDVRKPAVNHARSELARILEQHGARVVFVNLPLVKKELT
jgi:putative DNA primase/helicase